MNASKKGDVVAKSFHHQKMNGSEEKLSNNSNKWSINKSQLQGGPLTKQDILDVYSDVFTWDREVSRNAIQIPTQSKMQNP